MNTDIVIEKLENFVKYCKLYKTTTTKIDKEIERLTSLKHYLDQTFNIGIQSFDINTNIQSIPEAVTENEKLQEKITHLQLENEQLVLHYDVVLSSSDNKIKEITNENKEITKKLIKLNQDYDELGYKYEDSISHINMLNTRIEYMKMFARVHDELKEKFRNDEENEEIKCLKVELKNMTESYESLEKNHQKANVLIYNMNIQQNEHITRIADIKDLLSEARQEIIKIREENFALEKQNEKLARKFGYYGKWIYE